MTVVNLIVQSTWKLRVPFAFLALKNKKKQKDNHIEVKPTSIYLKCQKNASAYLQDERGVLPDFLHLQRELTLLGFS